MSTNIPNLILISSLLAISMSWRVATGDEPIKNMPPPWGGKVPPDEVRIDVKSDRGKSKTSWPLEYSAQAKGRPDGRASCVMSFYAKPLTSLDPPASWTFSRNHWEDGDFFPVCGTIYQWHYDGSRYGTFKRIPEHPLNVPIEQAVNVLVLPLDGGLTLIESPDVRQSVKLSVDMGKLGHLSDEGARLPLRILYRHINKYENMSLDATPGETLRIGTWKLKVDRFVPRQPTSNVPGWIEFRVITANPVSD